MTIRPVSRGCAAAVIGGLAALLSLSAAGPALAHDASDRAGASSDAADAAGPGITNPDDVTIGVPVKDQLTLSSGAKVTGTKGLPAGLVLTADGLLAGTASPNEAKLYLVDVTLTDATTTVTRGLYVTLRGVDANSQTRTYDVPWMGGSFGEARCPSTHPWLRNETFPGHSLPKGIAAITHGGFAMTASGPTLVDDEYRALGISKLSISNLGSQGAAHLVLHCTNDKLKSYIKGWG